MHDWKYIKCNPATLIGNVQYNYLTSDWYILDIEEYPRKEKSLVNVKQKTAYFLDIDEAFEQLYQLRA